MMTADSLNKHRHETQTIYYYNACLIGGELHS
jgi:hypothetical protein